MAFQKRGLIFCVLVTLVIFIESEAQETEPRGFLKCPTSRAATFMYFSDIWTTVPEPNTMYDSLNCGNVKILHGDLKGKCGVCGDYYYGPRHNEVPNGKYAAIRNPTYIYQEASVINVTVEVSANGNGGYYIFKLCNPKNAFEETQDCFDETVLSLANSPQIKEVRVPKVNVPNDIVVPLQLPRKFNCKVCTMQWTWVTHVDEGCEVVNGKHICGEGHGPQTTLVNCADISIVPQNLKIPENFPWPDFTSKYDSLAHKDDTHPKVTVNTPIPPLVVDRSKEGNTKVPKNSNRRRRPPTNSNRRRRPQPQPRIFPKPEWTKPEEPQEPTNPEKTDTSNTPDKEPTAQTTTVSPIVKGKYKKSTGGLAAIGLLELLIPGGLLLGLSGMLFDRNDGRARLNQFPTGQPGMVVGIHPMAAEHRVLIGEPVAAGGLAGAAGVPVNPVPVAGLSPVLTGIDISDVHIQQLIPLIPVIATPEVFQLIPTSFPDNSRLRVLLPLIAERRRLVQVFPQFSPQQITQMHLRYHAMHSQAAPNGRIQGLGGANQGQVGIGGMIQGQGGVMGTANMNTAQNTNGRIGNQWYYNNFRNNENSGFFELPQDHSFSNATLTTNYLRPSRGDLANPEIEFDREPDVLIERESRKKMSPYSKNCPPVEQICKTKFRTKDATIYGAVSIMEMICEIECSNGKQSCPADICICACPDIAKDSLFDMMGDF